MIDNMCMYQSLNISTGTVMKNLPDHLKTKKNV